ncbi:exported hypothetical protein [Candidatus Sulfopaludibacter sp. SbA3]|nr:exported hypothetical protein [Candidatus Sulfopaludibacter sp. SbA3]
MLRHKFILGVLILAAAVLPQARAASILFTLSTGGSFSDSHQVLTYVDSGFTMVLTGYDCGASVSYCDSVPTQNNSTTAISRGSSGLGLTNDPQSGTYEIPRNEFVQVDLSVVPAHTTITSIQFNLAGIIDGWDIYSSTKASELDSTTTKTGTQVTPAAQGNNNTGFSLASYPNIASTVSTGATTGYSTIVTGSAGYFNVTALQADCETMLSSITVNYSGTTTPEPGGLILAGCALIGIGLIGKRKKKA